MFAAVEPGYNTDFARDVAAGLKRRQKTIPACWLYDDLGSALFEAITFLPEYGLTRADGELLSRCAPRVIEAAGRPPLIIELGSGTGAKTKHLLEAAAAIRRVRYLPIDISPAALRACEQTLGDIENVIIEPLAATYLTGLREALAKRKPAECALILFLGSTIGNFSPAERSAFLKQLRNLVAPGDSLLLGTDLIKPPDVLIPAYDDALGITAAFNRNLLARMNRELGAHFDLAAFTHEARFNQAHSRIEMHLRALTPHHVRIDALNLKVTFTKGETIWTESCHKFTAEQVQRLGAQSGWTAADQWLDHQWGFAETLLTA